MAFYTTLRDYKFDNESDDIRRAPVFDVTEQAELGWVDDALVEADSHRIDYIIVITADRSRRVLLPADGVHLSGDNFAAALTVDQFAALPDFDLAAMENPRAWAEIESAYREAFLKIGAPFRMPPIEPAVTQGESTLADLLRERESPAHSEEVRREGEIARQLSPRPGRPIFGPALNKRA